MDATPVHCIECKTAVGFSFLDLLSHASAFFDENKVGAAGDVFGDATARNHSKSPQTTTVRSRFSRRCSHCSKCKKAPISRGFQVVGAVGFEPTTPNPPARCAWREKPQ